MPSWLNLLAVGTATCGLLVTVSACAAKKTADAHVVGTVTLCGASSQLAALPRTARSLCSTCTTTWWRRSELAGTVGSRSTCSPAPTRSPRIRVSARSRSLPWRGGRLTPHSWFPSSSHDREPLGGRPRWLAARPHAPDSRSVAVTRNAVTARDGSALLLRRAPPIVGTGYMSPTRSRMRSRSVPTWPGPEAGRPRGLAVPQPEDQRDGRRGDSPDPQRHGSLGRRTGTRGRSSAARPWFLVTPIMPPVTVAE
jgi:hypothetical protein